jgi:hypothetical protein
MAVLLDLVLLLVVARALWRLGGGIIAGMKVQTRSPTAPAHGVQMVRDPVCGTFVVPDHAMSLTLGRQRVYFCSAACRDRYRLGPSTSADSSGHVDGRNSGPAEGRTA